MTSIDELYAALKILVPLPPLRDMREYHKLQGAFDELIALREWKERAIPLLHALTDEENAIRENDQGVCTFCWQRTHTVDCVVVKVHTLLAENPS